MKSIVFSLLALTLTASLACNRKQGHTEHEHEKGTETPPLESEKLSLEGIRGLRLMQVPAPRQEGRWVPAEARGDEASQALLSSPVKGIVARLIAAPGQRLGAGAPLALIQSPELARLKGAWLSAKARLDRAQADLARETRLFQAGAGAKRELEAAQGEAATAKAEEEAARLGLEALGLSASGPDSSAGSGASFTVKAPTAGTVGSWKVLKGQGVEAGQELGSFQAAQAALVLLELPPPAPAWSLAALAEVRQGDGRSWKARLEGLPTTLTADTKRLTYRLRLQGGNLPVPGSALEVQVPVGSGLYLPQSALQQVEGRWGVFVVEGREASFRPVRRGPDLKGEVLIEEGLKPGETVVAEGAYLLKATQQKRSEAKEGGEAGHGH